MTITNNTGTVDYLHTFIGHETNYLALTEECPALVERQFELLLRLKSDVGDALGARRQADRLGLQRRQELPHVLLLGVGGQPRDLGGELDVEFPHGRRLRLDIPLGWRLLGLDARVTVHCQVIVALRGLLHNLRAQKLQQKGEKTTNN